MKPVNLNGHSGFEVEDGVVVELSPSGLDRVELCPGAPRAEAPYPNVTGAAAARGIALHKVSSAIIRARFGIGPAEHRPPAEYASPARWLGQDIDGYLVTEDDVDQLETDLTDTEAAVERLELVEFWDEIRLSITSVIKGLSGSADFVGLSADRKTIYLKDLKTGGALVSVETRQLDAYSVGAVETLAFLADLSGLERIVVAISQPSLGQYVERSIAPADLPELRATLRDIVERALDPAAPRRPGEKQCRYCRHAAHCDALRQIVFELPELAERIGGVTEAHKLGALLDKAEAAEVAAKAIRQHVITTLRTGQPVSGRRLIQSFSNRAWSDEAEAAAMLEAGGIEPYVKTLIAPAKAEKALKKGPKKGFEVNLEHYTVRAPRGPSLVKFNPHDTRPAFAPDGAEFQPVPESEK